jgi:2-C-methyl-D-erythritol 4-phosphate cytidylyltransferase/2-C-methyl-D-erythritol 2,4-cyclodiphosphate synthase
MHNNSSPLNKKIATLIVAAGRGHRAQTTLPKQYEKLNGQMVLTQTLRRFEACGPIIVAIHPDDEELLNQAVTGFKSNITSVMGGDTRTASVKAGLKALKSENPDYVLIHDAARPFVGTTIINAVIEGLENHPAIVPVLPIVDALKTKDGDSLDRNTIVRAQTPQGFHYAKILQAYDTLDPQQSFADDIEVARHAGLDIGMCPGDEANIKLTYAQDFKQKATMITITGNGFDVHRICEGKNMHLCGIKLDAGFSLKGHSDADVGLHAITDALYGAISAGDIGDHFPPDNEKWRGVSSDVFLTHAKDMVIKCGGIIDHVDITLICERPKIKPYRQEMRQCIADILEISINRVSVKATTTEGLGYTGRGEGIAAQASATIRLPDDH